MVRIDGNDERGEDVKGFKSTYKEWDVDFIQKFEEWMENMLGKYHITATNISMLTVH